MRTNDVDFLPITRRCQCPTETPDGKRGRLPPLRIYGPAAEAIAKSGILASSTPFESYRCGKCKGQMVYTAGDCHLALRKSS